MSSSELSSSLPEASQKQLPELPGGGFGGAGRCCLLSPSPLLVLCQAEWRHFIRELCPFEERSPEERVAKGEVWAELNTSLGLAPGFDRIFESFLLAMSV